MTRMHETCEQAAEKPHILRCARPPCFNVLEAYASAHRNLPRLVSEIFLSRLHLENRNDF